MTYNELAQKILTLPQEQRQQNVTVLLTINQYVQEYIQVASSNDVLDAGHFVLGVEF